MINIDLDRLLPSMFQEDICENGVSGNISQLGVISIKSLLPSIDSLGNKIDYRRFQEELKLWQDYRKQEARSLTNVIGVVDPNIYYRDQDTTIAYRLLPIMVANTDPFIQEEEVIKNILFTTGNIESLLEWILVGKILYMLIEKQGDIVEGIKEYIIGLSQRDFLDKYKKYYRLPISEYQGNFSIKFERERISLISLLNGIPTSRYEVLKDILDIVNGGQARTLFGKIIYNSQEEVNSSYQIDRFHENMADYVLRLRKSRIEPERLIIKEYILPDIFEFEEGVTFFHSLLREAKVIKKEISNNMLTSLIQTKSGMYTFKRDLI